MPSLPGPTETVNASRFSLCFARSLCFGVGVRAAGSGSVGGPGAGPTDPLCVCTRTDITRTGLTLAGAGSGSIGGPGDGPTDPSCVCTRTDCTRAGVGSGAGASFGSHTAFSATTFSAAALSEVAACRAAAALSAAASFPAATVSAADASAAALSSAALSSAAARSATAAAAAVFTAAASDAAALSASAFSAALLSIACACRSCCAAASSFDAPGDALVSPAVGIGACAAFPRRARASCSATPAGSIETWLGRRSKGLERRLIRRPGVRGNPFVSDVVSIGMKSSFFVAAAALGDAMAAFARGDGVPVRSCSFSERSAAAIACDDMSAV